MREDYSERREAPRRREYPSEARDYPRGREERYDSREVPRRREEPSEVRGVPRRREEPSESREAPRRRVEPSEVREVPRRREEPSESREAPRRREEPSEVRETPRRREESSGIQKTPHAQQQDGGEEKTSDRLYSAFCLVFCLVFFAFLSGVAITGIKMPDCEKSESENRMLRQMPSISWGAITDGSYMRDLETYLTDQFPYRDKIVSEKTFIDMMNGKQKINGVYLGSDSYLFDSQSKADKDDLDTKLSSIQKFCTYEENAQCSVAIVPNATYVLADNLPYGAHFEDQGNCIKEINDRLKTAKTGGEGEIKAIDCVSPLTKQLDFQKYYRTDHHWTTRSAYEVFKEIASAFSLDTSAVNYEFMEVTDSFQGTLASSSGLHHINDSVEICWPNDFSGKYVIEYEAEQTKRTSFFVSEKLSGGNQYEVFMGGNYGKIIISSDTTRKKNLLLIKDSYANCMIPMLVPYFSKIVVIDPRYLNDDLSDVIQDYSFTHILFLYNLNTFLEDTSLVDAINIRMPAAESETESTAA